MQINRLSKNEIDDFRDLIEIFKIVFENDIQIPSNQYLSKLLSNPDFIVFVVKIENKVVGGLTVYILHQYYSEKPLAYIYDVGIALDFQRKGLGKALMNEICAFCKINGFDDAYVEVEEEDIDAVNFYRKTNFSSEIGARHFTYSFTEEN
jgi:aminoglycoside 3-N-acetyltransferase I